MKKTNIIAIFVIPYTIYLILNTGMAVASGTKLSVYPSLTEIKTKTPSEINSKLFVENLSDDPTDLSIQIKLFKAGGSEDGKVEYLDQNDNPNHILDRVKVIKDNSEITEFSLGPKQKADLSLKISLSNSDLNRDYYFSIVFITKSKSYQLQNTPDKSAQSSISTINTGVATNVLLSIGPSTANSISIDEFSVPTFIQKGPLGFNIKIQNTGSNYLKPNGTIIITNMFGQTIGKVELPSEIILGNSSRYLSNQSLSTPQPADRLITSKIRDSKVVWPEKFLLGFYKARLTIQASDKEPAVTETINFTAFPFKATIEFIIVVVLLSIIYRRVKQKMAE